MIINFNEIAIEVFRGRRDNMIRAEAVTFSHALAINTWLRL